jgi:hypothetical protein
MTDLGTEPREPPRGADVMAERAAFLTSEAGEGDDARERRRRLAAGLAAAARAGARGTGRGVRAGRDWLAAQVIAMAPRLRARDQAALRAQFPGLGTEELAGALIKDAARASAAVGGAVGMWAMLPLLPIFPAEVAAETLAAVGIEIKLVAELHEAYGMPAAGSPAEQMTAYAGAWAGRCAVTAGPGGLITAAASPQAGRLARRLVFRAIKTALSFGPLFLGALMGARLNRRETRRLGRAVRTDLRRRAHTPAPAPR